jgi:hypothetical protein
MPEMVQEMEDVLYVGLVWEKPILEKQSEKEY